MRYTNPKKPEKGGFAKLRRLCPEIVEAAEIASKQLSSIGVSHALCGGMALAAHGLTRVTDDADFVVGEEAFESTGIIVTFKPGVPICVPTAAGEIGIDILSEEVDGSIEHAEEHDGLPVIDLESLILMKVSAGRPQDKADIRRLLDGMTLEEVDVLLTRIEAYEGEVPEWMTDYYDVRSWSEQDA